MVVSVLANGTVNEIFSNMFHLRIKRYSREILLCYFYVQSFMYGIIIC